MEELSVVSHTGSIHPKGRYWDNWRNSHVFSEWGVYGSSLHSPPLCKFEMEIVIYDLKKEITPDLTQTPPSLTKLDTCPPRDKAC